MANKCAICITAIFMDGKCPENPMQILNLRIIIENWRLNRQSSLVVVNLPICLFSLICLNENEIISAQITNHYFDWAEKKEKTKRKSQMDRQCHTNLNYYCRFPDCFPGAISKTDAHPTTPPVQCIIFCVSFNWFGCRGF